MMMVIFFQPRLPVPLSAPRRPPAPSLGKKEATHERILAVASRTVRRRGLHGVGVADVMKESGLTHGGFYAHFDSRETLLAETLDRTRLAMAATFGQRVAQPRGRGKSAFRALVEGYLADASLAAFETACPVAALASDLARCTDASPDRAGALPSAARHLVADLIAGVRTVLPVHVDPAAATTIAATLVGTLQLARTLGGREALAMLAAARRALLTHYDTEPPPLHASPRSS